MLNRVIELVTLKRKGSVNETWTGDNGVYACRAWQMDVTLGLLRGPTGEQPAVLPRSILDHPDYIDVMGNAAPIGIVTGRFQRMTQYEVDFEHRRIVFELWEPHTSDLTTFPAKQLHVKDGTITICNSTFKTPLSEWKGNEVTEFVTEVTNEAKLMEGVKEPQHGDWLGTEHRPNEFGGAYRFASIFQNDGVSYVLEMHVYKRFNTLVAQIFAVVLWCGRIHRRLVWTSNCHLAFGTLLPPPYRNHIPTTRLLNSAGSIALSKGDICGTGPHLRILAHRAQGAPLENLPVRYLFGIVPEALTDHNIAWSMGSTIIFVPTGRLPPNNSAAAKEAQASAPTEDAFVIDIGSGTSQIKWGERQLINIMYVEDNYVDKAIRLFNRMEFMSHLLVRVKGEKHYDMEFLLPRSALRFRFRSYISVTGAKEYRLASLAHSGLFINNKRGEEFWELIELNKPANR